MAPTNNYPGKKHVSNIILLLVFAGLRLARGNNSSCFNDTGAIVIEELSVDDTSIIRTYHLCEDTTYKFATKNNTKCNESNGTDCYDDNGFEPLLVFQPNVHILCGSDGGSSNGCVFEGGTWQLGVQLPSSIPAMVDREDEFIDNVEISGVTFRDAVGEEGNNVYTRAPANVTLKNCIFKDNKAGPCVSVYDTDFFQASWTGTNFSSLTLDTCTFENNAQESTLFEFQNITINTVVQNQGKLVRVMDTTFSKNILPTEIDFSAFSLKRISALVGNLDGTLEVSGSCFSENKISIAPVVNLFGEFSERHNSALDNTYDLAVAGALLGIEGCDGILNVTSFDIGAVQECTPFTSPAACRPTQSPTSAPSMAPSRSQRPSSSPTTATPITQPTTEPTSVATTLHLIGSLTAVPFLCACIFL